MQGERANVQVILELTRAIEVARVALRDENTPATRDHLRTAEDAYRTYLMGLNGMDLGCGWPVSPL